MNSLHVSPRLLSVALTLCLAAAASGQQSPPAATQSPRDSVQTYPRQTFPQSDPYRGMRGGPPVRPYYDAGPRLSNSSFTFIPPTQPRKFAKHDIIFIVVQESAESTLEADVQRRKNSLYNAVLQDFVVLKDLFTVKPSPQSDGDPTISGQLNQTYRAENESESREAIQLKIAARVADIQPNGHLVLEAHKRIRVNNELMEVSLSGVTDPRDILPDRSVQSERIVNLQLERRNSGHVRDAVRRGWLTRIVDTFNPF